MTPYGKRDDSGRLNCDIHLETWRTYEGRWVVRAETRDDQGRRHTRFITGDDPSGWVFEADAETALRQMVTDAMRGGSK